MLVFIPQTHLRRSDVKIWNFCEGFTAGQAFSKMDVIPLPLVSQSERGFEVRFFMLESEAEHGISEPILVDDVLAFVILMPY